MEPPDTPGPFKLALDHPCRGLMRSAFESRVPAEHGQEGLQNRKLMSADTLRSLSWFSFP